MTEFTGFEDLHEMPSGSDIKNGEEERHICDKCLGTGEFKGMRIHQEKSQIPTILKVLPIGIDI